MWITFVLCILICVAMLYVPGFLFGRALCLDGPLALAVAPIVSIAGYAVLPVLYAKAGITCSWVNIIGPVLLLSLAVFFVSWAIKRGMQGQRTALSDTSCRIDNRGDWFLLGLYLVVGFLVCAMVYLVNLDGPESYYCRYDNVSHFTYIAAFLETGIWSSIDITAFIDPSTVNYGIKGSGAFYPTAFHGIAALVMQLTGCSLAMSVNVVCTVVAGIIFPLSMFALMRQFYAQDGEEIVPRKCNKTLMVFGAFIAPAFAAFPWTMFYKGPLLANMLGYALVPGVVALLVFTTKSAIKRRQVVQIIVFGCIAFVSLALAQTNGLFVVFSFGIFYFYVKIYREFVRGKKGNDKLKTTLKFTSIYSIAVIAIWFSCTQVPFLQATVQFYDGVQGDNTFMQALWRGLSLEMYTRTPQLFLAALCLIGVVYLGAKKNFWVAATGCFFMGLYIVGKCIEDLPSWAFLLTGFWYSDPVRLGAQAAIFLVPVASAGLLCVYWWVRQIAHVILEKLRRTPPNKEERASLSKRANKIGLVAPVVLLCLCNYVPGNTSLGYIEEHIKRHNDMSTEQIYSAEEREFVQRVLDVVPEGTLIINDPHDGSVFAYALDGLNTYFRQVDGAKLSDQGMLIAEELNTAAANDQVREVLKETGAQYVLHLDQGVPYRTPTENGRWLYQSTEESVGIFTGVKDVSRKSDGFELVLANKDMRLYKINLP